MMFENHGGKAAVRRTHSAGGIGPMGAPSSGSLRDLERYAKGIMTLTGSPLETLRSVARDPASVPGWTGLLERHPRDVAVLRDFFARLLNHYFDTGQLPRSKD
jgi:hypothetical protein